MYMFEYRVNFYKNTTCWPGGTADNPAQDSSYDVPFTYNTLKDFTFPDFFPKSQDNPYPDF